MNISKHEQRVLHALAQGGAIHFQRSPGGKIEAVQCFNRDGHVLTDCSLEVFNRLKKLHFIRSAGGKPYRLTVAGARAVNAQFDNQ